MNSFCLCRFGFHQIVTDGLVPVFHDTKDVEAPQNWFRGICNLESIPLVKSIDRDRGISGLDYRFCILGIRVEHSL